VVFEAFQTSASGGYRVQSASCCMCPEVGELMWTEVAFRKRTTSEPQSVPRAFSKVLRATNSPSIRWR